MSTTNSYTFASAMVSYFNAVAEAFWNEEFWLPPNVTWALLDQKTDSTPAVRFCQYRDLAIPLCTCWVMLAVKFVLENVVFRAVGRYAGLPERNKSKMPPTNEVLEAEYQSGRRLDHANISRYGNICQGIEQFDPMTVAKRKGNFPFRTKNECPGLKNIRIFVFVRIFVYGRIFGLLPNIRPFYRIYGQLSTTKQELQSKFINFKANLG